jgi:hypothetical protein
MEPRMQPSPTHTRIVRLLNDARNELMMSVQCISEEQTEAPGPDGWSVKDILGHVAMWEEMALSDMRRAARGDKTALDAWDHSFDDQWNHIHVVLRKRFPLGQVLRELAEMRRATIEALGSVQEDQLTSGFIPSTCAVHARHDRDHAKQIRELRQDR